MEIYYVPIRALIFIVNCKKETKRLTIVFMICKNNNNNEINLISDP